MAQNSGASGDVCKVAIRYLTLTIERRARLFREAAQELLRFSTMQQSESESNCFTKLRRFANMDARKQLGLLCNCAILLYFSSAVLDYLTLFSGNWGMVTIQSNNSIHVLYGPWQICWISENSFTCKNHSWKSTALLPTILLLYSVIIGKIIFLGCLYQLMSIFQIKGSSRPTIMIAVVLKMILCAISLILHIVVTSLPKEIVNGQKLITLWNSNLTVIISTGLIVILMLLLVYELFFVMKEFRPPFRNTSNLQEEGFLNPSFRSRSPVKTWSSVEQLGTDQSVSDSDFSWKGLSVAGPSNIVSAGHSNDSSKDEFSYNECQEDFGFPNNVSDSCSTVYSTRDFKRNNELRMTIDNEEMSDISRSQELLTKEPNASGVIIKGQNNKKLRSVSVIKLREKVEEKIIEGHEIVPFNQTVLLLRRNIQHEWELDEMKAYVFQNISASDSKLVIFELKNYASQLDFTEVKQNSENSCDETSNFKRLPSYPYYYPHNTSAPHVEYSSKWNLAIPAKK